MTAAAASPSAPLVRSGQRRTPHEVAARQASKLQARLGNPMGEQAILDAYGFAEETETGLERTPINATGPQLRGTMSADFCRSAGIYPIELVNGVMRIHAVRALTPTVNSRLVHMAQSAGFEIASIAVVPEDQTRIIRLLDAFESISSDRIQDIVSRINTAASASQQIEGTLIAQVLDAIITEALQARASDIHLEYDQDNALQCWVRYRVDGDLRAMHNLAPAAMRPIMAAIKTRADIDASDVERPQDGRMNFQWNGRAIDMRMATIRHTSGEKIVIRLLDPAALLSLRTLFEHSPVAYERLKAYTSDHVKGQGILILSGPTGQGKTTTIYGVIMAIDRMVQNVMTAEAPVEARIPWVTQSPVRDMPGRSFAELVRAFLRQDPDIIVIGETRDTETAEALARAAETGHHVITSVHANDVTQTLERTCGMFSPGYATIGASIIANALYGIVNQRLVKRVCPRCSTQESLRDILPTLGHRQRQALEAISPAGATVPKAHQTDCPVCNGTGYRGRVLIAECLFMPPGTDIRSQIAKLVAEGRHSDILGLDGITYVDRAAAAAPLLRNGLIDSETYKIATGDHG